MATMYGYSSVVFPASLLLGDGDKLEIESSFNNGADYTLMLQDDNGVVTGVGNETEFEIPALEQGNQIHTRVRITTDHETEPLNFSTEWLEGYVTDKNGAGVNGVEVDVYPRGSDKRLTWTVSKTNVKNGLLGYYGIEVPPGAYDVKFYGGGVSPIRVDAKDDLAKTVGYSGGGFKSKIGMGASEVIKQADLAYIRHVASDLR